ncbi:DUF6264 family protein [Nocardioides sp. AX2bis]|uniref:DUF6264 family protein n=1 Tax=Nocardioides sp. AX2bis TaxID=2653157 RepID=UPI0012EFE6B7|nr:conserved membrane hypothetical protein [Nocardioides sp. AX2bis]
MATAPDLPPPAAAPAPAAGRRTADVVVTVVLLLVTGALGLVAAFFGMFTGMVSDGCFGDDLCGSRVGTGTLINVLAPVVCWIAAVVVCARRLARRQPAWWVPLVAVVAWFLLVLVGSAVATSAMPS